MKTLGIVLAVLGLMIGCGALLMDTTVFSPGMPSIGGYVGTEPSRTHNLGLLQKQELAFIGGAALFVAGCVVAAIGQLEVAIGQRIVGQGVHQSSADGAVDAQVAPTTAMPGEWAAAADDDTDYKRLVIIVGGVLLAVMALLLAFVPGKSPEAAAIEANADMLADNLEAQADNLEALADNAMRYR